MAAATTQTTGGKCVLRSRVFFLFSLSFESTNSCLL
jgi:hypothetical protein